MPPKRKSDVIDLSEDTEQVTTVSKPKKKARVSKVSPPPDDEEGDDDNEAGPSSSRAPIKPKHWTDIRLDGEDVRTRNFCNS